MSILKAPILQFGRLLLEVCTRVNGFLLTAAKGRKLQPTNAGYLSVADLIVHDDDLTPVKYDSYRLEGAGSIKLARRGVGDRLDAIYPPSKT